LPSLGRQFHPTPNPCTYFCHSVVMLYCHYLFICLSFSLANRRSDLSSKQSEVNSLATTGSVEQTWTQPTHWNLAWSGQDQLNPRHHHHPPRPMRKKDNASGYEPQKHCCNSNKMGSVVHVFQLHLQGLTNQLHRILGLPVSPAFPSNSSAQMDLATLSIYPVTHKTLRYRSHQLEFSNT
jgi:hypothetical protein